MSGIITEDRIVPAWLQTMRHLEKHGRRDRNILLEIADPMTVLSHERAAIGVVDDALRRHQNLSVLTVAGTIFPYALYKKVGAEKLADRFLAIMDRAQEPGTWGTYAMRLMRRAGKTPGSTVNPLELVIQKLRRAAGSGKPYTSNYELGVHDVAEIDEGHAFCEVPLYGVARDGAMVSNFPCLSHLTFKLVKKRSLELTAIYRSHYYAQRALGNLVGLSHLLRFVSAETGIPAGRLTCISTDAHLDFESWGGVGSGKAVLAGVEAAMKTSTEGLAPAVAQSSEACSPA